MSFPDSPSVRISSERHRAEVRRAVNDELLAAIAGWYVYYNVCFQQCVHNHVSHLPSIDSTASISIIIQCRV